MNIFITVLFVIGGLVFIFISLVIIYESIRDKKLKNKIINVKCCWCGEDCSINMFDFKMYGGRTCDREWCVEERRLIKQWKLDKWYEQYKDKINTYRCMGAVIGITKQDREAYYEFMDKLNA